MRQWIQEAEIVEILLIYDADILIDLLVCTLADSKIKPNSVLLPFSRLVFQGSGFITSFVPLAVKDAHHLLFSLILWGNTAETVHFEIFFVPVFLTVTVYCV